MHVQIVKIILLGWLVLLSGESDEPFVVDVDAERIAACDEGVDAEIEFEAFVEEGIVDVGLYDALPMTLDFSDILIKVHERDWVRKMPRPWQLASGFTIKVLLSPFLRDS